MEIRGGITAPKLRWGIFLFVTNGVNQRDARPDPLGGFRRAVPVHMFHGANKGNSAMYEKFLTALGPMAKVMLNRAVIAFLAAASGVLVAAFPLQMAALCGGSL